MPTLPRCLTRTEPPPPIPCSLSLTLTHPLRAPPVSLKEHLKGLVAEVNESRKGNASIINERETLRSERDELAASLAQVSQITAPQISTSHFRHITRTRPRLHYAPLTANPLPNPLPNPPLLSLS